MGMGPTGELGYPSYLESNGTWKFPSIGSFHCYGVSISLYCSILVSILKATSKAAGKKEWGNGGPSDAGHYNKCPEETPFFHGDGG